VFIGLDLGTGGARALAVAADGQVAAAASAPIASSPAAAPAHEQSPQDWWRACCEALGRVSADLRAAGVPPEALRGLAVDGTSGTLVCLDDRGRPLRPAMMYNDGRASAEAEELNAAAASFCEKLGYRFAASYALAKILWVRNREPAVFERAARFCHQADYIVGRLTGDFGVTDYSNALKTGYDLVDERWPDWLDAIAGVRERLPRVVAPGSHIGAVSAEAATATGLPAGLPVAAGASDGTAACLASGVRRPGDYNTTLGTTLVFKGVSRSPARHPQGLVYSHKLPGGLWLPGAASNTGAEWINALFPGRDVRAMDLAAEPRLPCDCVAYPLVRRGERFPFLCGRAEGFFAPEPADETERYAACLQAEALLERMGYEVLDQVTGNTGGEVFSTGAASRSSVWTQCRADASGRVFHTPACPESAFGSAVLAAAAAHRGDVWEAAAAMVRIEKTFAPRHALRSRYDALYERFRGELRRRGYA